MPSAILQEQSIIETLLALIPSLNDRQEMRMFINEHPGVCERLIQNFEQKKEIFKSGDKKALEKLLEEERQMIASV
ncbi:MAG: hypothetical protein Q7S16_03210 [bacterium]|nr:hypothetical protein [bacterium]